MFLLAFHNYSNLYFLGHTHSSHGGHILDRNERFITYIYYCHYSTSHQTTARATPICLPIAWMIIDMVIHPDQAINTISTISSRTEKRIVYEAHPA